MTGTRVKWLICDVIVVDILHLCNKMAYYDPSQTALAASKIRSQSDSNLLSQPPTGNGVGSLKRNTSMDDMNVRGKRKNFLYKLVRPWKWRSRRKSKTKSHGELPAHAN